MHNGAEEMEMSLSALRDYVFSKTQRKCQVVMNKQTHCGETVRNNTDLDFDLGLGSDTLLASQHNDRAKKSQPVRR